MKIQLLALAAFALPLAAYAHPGHGTGLLLKAEHLQLAEVVDGRRRQ